MDTKSPGGGNAPGAATAHGTYEIWRVVDGERTWERSFPELRLALRYADSQEVGRFDIRLPDGSWLGERATEKLPPLR